MKILTPLLFCCLALAGNAQLKQTIDEELLSGLVQAKQEEVRTRLLRNLVQSTIKSSNVATYNTVNDVLEALLTEKNRSAMIRDITTIVAEHSIAYAASWYLILDAKNCSECYADDQRIGFLQTDRANIAPWEQLRLEVAMMGSKGKNRDRQAVRSPAGDSSLMEFHGFIFDTLTVLLRDGRFRNGSVSDWLTKKGLFTATQQRPWQGRIDQRYENLWLGHEGQRTRLVKQIEAFLGRFTSGGIRISELAEKVGLKNMRALDEIDLTNLSGLRFNPMEVFHGNASTNEAAKAVFGLFQKAVEIYRTDASENRYIARIADFIDKYVILDPEKLDPGSRLGFTIDVEGIILSLEDFIVDGVASPTRNCFFNVRPYFTIGLNYGAFRDPSLGFTLDETNGITTIAWAGEKIGLKWRWWDWKYTRGQQVGAVFKYHGRTYRRLVRPKEPAVSNFYLNAYASGLLYTIADLRSENVFSNPIVGVGAGITLFNGLETNLSYAVPVLDRSNIGENLDAGFWNVGLDIPIFDYIRAARAKRAK